QPFAHRPAVVGSGAGQDHNELSLTAAHMVIGPQRVSNDLGDRAEAPFGSASGGRRLGGRVDRGDKNRDRTFRRSTRYGGLGRYDELVRGAVEMRHEPTVERSSRPRKTRSVSLGAKLLTRVGLARLVSSCRFLLQLQSFMVMRT